MKTNIKMRVTPEQSKKVQEICFKNGIQWRLNLNTISHINKPYLAIEPTVIFYRSTEIDYLNISSLFKEIDADLFIRTNGTCEEISDEGLSKIKVASEGKSTEYLQEKIINLHKQINKDIATIKNQKEELHKLNLKLQKFISLEEHNQVVEKINKDNVNYLSNNILSRDKEIEKLKAVIEYLESKIKWKN